MVEQQLKTVPGVQAVKIDYNAKTATCTVKKGTDPKVVAGGLSGKYTGSVQG